MDLPSSSLEMAARASFDWRKRPSACLRLLWRSRSWFSSCSCWDLSWLSWSRDSVLMSISFDAMAAAVLAGGADRVRRRHCARARPQRARRDRQRLCGEADGLRQ